MGLWDFCFSGEENQIVKKYIIPKKIILTKGTKNSEYLLADFPRQSTLGKAKVCIFEKGEYVLLDFGSELQGGVDITVKSVKVGNEKIRGCGRLRIVFGESVSEALSNIGGEKNAQNEHSTRDMSVVTTSWSTMRYGNTGFRFVKIESEEGIIEISAIKGVLEYRDIEYKGSFRCNDERLNRIFDTAAYTVHLNMQDYIWDGIKRDRLVWMGDMHPEVSTICSVFGYNESVEKSLDFARDSFPVSDSKPVWITFPSYTCWWITIQWEWYMQNGRLDYLLEQKAYMYNVCENLIKSIGEDGEIFISENFFFVDWSSAESHYAEAGFRGCIIIALESASKIFEVYKDSKMSERCLNIVKNIKKKVPDFSGNKQICAMAALSGLCDMKTAEKIITKDLLCGLSTFYGYYVLRALSKAGNIQAAIDILRGYWGAMLDLGATTFWEDFDIEWTKNAGRIDEPLCDGKTDIHGTYGKHCYIKLRLSLCHGWASGPADFISKNILGVEILEPGCRKVRISPKLGDLVWVKGTYPTPYGVIEIEHRKADGKIESKITAPKGVTFIKE